MNRPSSILLAEDDADDRELFLEAISLVDPSIKVDTVENGEKLMAHLRAAPLYPDCIFLDLNMPKKNGKECLKEIRANAKTQTIPVIIYTTSLSKKDIDETFDKGASFFIRKPNSFRELTDLLQKSIAAVPDSNAARIRNNFVLNAR